LSLSLARLAGLSRLSGTDEVGRHHPDEPPGMLSLPRLTLLVWLPVLPLV
jgi:hypothetical protein